jgi:hypothetical protein
MIAVVSLLLVITVSMLVTHVATIALTLTGLSREMARFQARSAFTGVGFTTRESESIVNHPVRRRILMMLMLFGNAGIAATVTTLIISFLSTTGSASTLLRMVLMLSGLVGLVLVSRSDWVDRRLSPIIKWALKRYTRLDVRDYASLFRLSRDYCISEIKVAAEDWMANKALLDLKLQEEGVLVLGIQRKAGQYIGAPHGKTVILPNDVLIVYGRLSLTRQLDSRMAGRAGEEAHRQAVQAQKTEDASSWY